jgi:hypothetical protein
MYITTPTEISSVAWEGELAPPENSMGLKSRQCPIITIGQPEIWPAAEALENEVGKKWVRPLGDARYWLVRLACTLREPKGQLNIVEAQQTLTLRPHSGSEDSLRVYVYSLYPHRLTVEDKDEFSISLGPELKFADQSEVKLGGLGAKIEFKKVFPVIQGYGAGTPTPYWIFKPHRSHPLDGTQFVYAVLVDRAYSDGIQGDLELTVTVQTQMGPIRYGMPKEAKDVRFTWEGSRNTVTQSTDVAIDQKGVLDILISSAYQLNEKVSIESSAKTITVSLQRVLSDAGPRQAEVLRRCAIPRWFDADVLAVLRERDDGNEYVLGQLCQYSFVRQLDEQHYTYHDEVRALLLTEWRDHHPDNLRTINLLLADYFEERARIVLQDVRTSSIASQFDERNLWKHEALYHRLMADPQTSVAQLEAAFAQAEAVHDLAEAEALLEVASDAAADRNTALPVEALWDRLEQAVLKLSKMTPDPIDEVGRQTEHNIAQVSIPPVDPTPQLPAAQAPSHQVLSHEEGYRLFQQAIAERDEAAIDRCSRSGRVAAAPVSGWLIALRTLLTMRWPGHGPRFRRSASHSFRP